MTEPKRLLRLSMMVHRKKGMSEEEFSKYWTQKHAPLVKEWLAKYGVLRYTQVGGHHSAELRISATIS